MSIKDVGSPDNQPPGAHPQERPVRCSQPLQRRGRGRLYSYSKALNKQHRVLEYSYIIHRLYFKQR